MRTIMILTGILLITDISPAYAYIGPGLGLGAIGAILGVILSVFLAIFALVWFPIKRSLKTRRNNQDSADLDMPRE